ncbi:DUF3823 domain-containing protein [Sphingobacterium sp. SG20118]|uniref:DUF3823 domain-containing protein n=1 Tax=Sphingobacterium sp. SG20118 TaxID=3367156 RepID=UPI0037DFC8D4
MFVLHLFFYICYTIITNIVFHLTIKKTVESSNLDQVKVFLRKSMLTDHVVFDQEIKIDLNNIVLGTETRVTAQLSTGLKDQDYIFARVGVKASSSEEYTYTSVQKIILK